MTLEYQQNTMQTAPPQLLPVYFYSQRESLPHCAMPEYIRSPARVHVLRGSEELEENSRACGVVLSENAIAGSMSSPGSQDADTVVGTGENSVPVVPAVVGTCAPSNAEDERRPPPHKVCYTEDDRVVCSVAYTVCPCAVLHQRQEYLLGMLLEKVMCNVPQEGDGILPNERCVSLLAESNGYSL